MKFLSYISILLFVLISTLSTFAFEQVSPTILRPPTDIEVAHEIEDSVKKMKWWAPGSPKWFYYASYYHNMFGTGNEGTYDVAIKYDAEDLKSVEWYNITSIGFVPSESTATYVIKIWTGEKGDSVVYSDTAKNLEFEKWNYIPLKNNIFVKPNQTYYFGINIIAKGGYPIGIEESKKAVNGKSDLFRGSGDFLSVNDLQGTNLSMNIAVYAELITYRQTTNACQPYTNNNTANIDDIKIKKAENIAQLEINHYSKKGNGSPDSYKIYRNNVEIANTFTNNYEDILNQGGIYYYKVSAVYDGIESQKSDSIEVWYDTNRIQVNKVVTETFINIGGGSSASPSVYKAITELKKERESTIAPLIYHSATSVLGDDPFSNFYAEERFMNYVLYTYSFPMTLFNGDYFIGGGSEQDLLPYYKEVYDLAYDIKTPISFNGKIEKISPSSYKLHADAEIVGMHNDAPLTMHVVLVEEAIDHTWNDTVFNQVSNVVRKMYPSVNGTPINFIDNKASLTVNIDFDPLADPNKYRMVAFIQDNATKKIFNGDQFKIPTKKNVTFSVTDGNHLPIEGVGIVLNNETFETDAEGKRVIGIWNNAGEVSYTVSHPNYDVYSGVFNIDTTSAINVMLFETNVSDYENSLVKVYPNPVSNTVSIEVSSPSTIEIINQAGKTVKRFRQTNDISSYSLSELVSGVYFIKVKNNNNSIVKRIVKL